MRTATWSYRLEHLREGDSGLDGYGVWAADGEALGQVAALLARGEERLVVWEAGARPRERALCALWLDDVDVDHDALAVHVRWTAAELEDHAVELDPERAVHGHAEADAERIQLLPDDLRPLADEPDDDTASGAGRQPAHGALALGLLSTLALLALLGAAAATGAWWLLVLAVIPLMTALGSTVAAVRASRRPADRRRSGHATPLR